MLGQQPKGYTKRETSINLINFGKKDKTLRPQIKNKMVFWTITITEVQTEAAQWSNST